MVNIYYFEDIICLEIDEEITEDDLGNYLEFLENNLYNEKCFSLLFNYIKDKVRKTTEVKKIESVWINRNKEILDKICYDFANVTVNNFKLNNNSKLFWL